MIIETSNYQDFLTITENDNKAIVYYAFDHDDGFSAYYITSFPSDMVIYGDSKNGKNGLGPQPPSFSNDFPKAILFDAVIRYGKGRNIIIYAGSYNDFLTLTSTFGKKGKILFEINQVQNTSSLYCLLSANVSITFSKVRVSFQTIKTDFPKAIQLNDVLDLSSNAFLDFSNYSDFLELVSIFGSKKNDVFYDSAGTGNFNIFYLLDNNNLFLYTGPAPTLNVDFPSAMLLNGPFNSISFDGSFA